MILMVGLTNTSKVVIMGNAREHHVYAEPAIGGTLAEMFTVFLSSVKSVGESTQLLIQSPLQIQNPPPRAPLRHCRARRRRRLGRSPLAPVLLDLTWWCGDAELRSLRPALVVVAGVQL